MALNLRGLCRLNFNLVNNAFLKPNFLKVGVRYLYIEKDLGIEGYEHGRMMFRNQFVTIEETFRNKLKEICEMEDGIIYTEDLKAIIHLAQDNDDDMKLLTTLFEKYQTRNSSAKISSYVFGPVMMRMYYYLNEPKYALDMFENPAFESSLNYRTTFRVLMCLLYKHNMYQEMRQVFDKILNTKGAEFIGTNSVLLYAACVKENTREAYDYVLDYWKRHVKIVKPSLRCTSLMIYASIQNNESTTALEIISTTSSERIMCLKNLKLLAYMNLNKWIQVLPILRSAFQTDTSVGNQRYLFFQDVLQELEEKVTSEDAEGAEEIVELIQKIKRNDAFMSYNSLEEYLLRPITFRGDELRRPRNRRYERRPREELKNYM